MAGTNATIVKNAIKEYKRQIEDDVEKRCRDYCGALCDFAIEFRKSSPYAHNFTGNLMNSIVVCLYKNKQPIFAEYATDYVRKAIQVKMTGPRKYHFSEDYDGATSDYRPEKWFVQGWGEDDARRFFQQYRPAGKNLFDIVVAYTTEYADFIERERGTTGIMDAYAHTDKFGVNFLQLPRVS